MYYSMLVLLHIDYDSAAQKSGSVETRVWPASRASQ